jgi:hypothetical protein
MGRTAFSELYRWLAAAAAFVFLATAPAAAQQLKVAGPYGLHVHQAGDSLTVQWMTQTPTRGMVRVQDGSRAVGRRTTPAGHAHRATFHAPGLDTVEIRFGALESTRDQYRVKLSLAPPPRPDAVFAAQDTLFVIGDTHGELDELIAGMRAAGIVDRNLRWAAGRSHVVFAGDMADRGADVLALLWLLYQLEPQATAAGGRLHVILGNHEIMVMLGDLRYVHEKEMFIAQQHGVSYDSMFDPQKSVLGRWLASRPGMVRIGDVVVVHGGVTPEYARLPIETFNDSLAHYVTTLPPLYARTADSTAVADSTSAAPDSSGRAADSAAADADQLRHDFLWSDRSVFWHRDYVRGTAPEAELDEALRLTSGRMLVVGHTAVQRIAPLYEGRVIATHTPRMGAELLKLVRGPDGIERYRISGNGPPERF